MTTKNKTLLDLKKGLKERNLTDITLGLCNIFGAKIISGKSAEIKTSSLAQSSDVVFQGRNLKLVEQSIHTILEEAGLIIHYIALTSEDNTDLPKARNLILDGNISSSKSYDFDDFQKSIFTLLEEKQGEAILRALKEKVCNFFKCI